MQFFLFILPQPIIWSWTFWVNGIPARKFGRSDQFVRSVVSFKDDVLVFSLSLLFILMIWLTKSCSDLSNNNLGNQIPYQLPPNLHQLYASNLHGKRKKKRIVSSVFAFQMPLVFFISNSPITQKPCWKWLQWWHPLFHISDDFPTIPVSQTSDNLQLFILCNN